MLLSQLKEIDSELHLEEVGKVLQVSDGVVRIYGLRNAEAGELLEAYRNGDQVNMQEEIGDLLFAVVNAARFLKVDPEEALNFTSDKFIRRFGYVEEQAIKAGTRPEEMTLEEMDKLWDDAKRMEK